MQRFYYQRTSTPPTPTHSMIPLHTELMQFPTSFCYTPVRTWHVRAGNVTQFNVFAMINSTAGCINEFLLICNTFPTNPHVNFYWNMPRYKLKYIAIISSHVGTKREKFNSTPDVAWLKQRFIDHVYCVVWDTKTWNRGTVYKLWNPGHDWRYSTEPLSLTASRKDRINKKKQI